MKIIGWIAPLALMTVTACGPQVPASNPGPGFSDYTQYQLERARRDAQLRGQTAVTGPRISDETRSVGLEPIGGPRPVVDPTTSGPIESTSLPPATSTAGAIPPAPVQVSTNNPGLSDEQNFDAVTSRQSIESDAQRRAAQAAAYQQVEPGALPTRSGREGPNIVAYALQATNYKGQSIYNRGFTRASASQRKCAAYPSADAAQIDFLSSGGPEKDRKGLDPDGDGFACSWDPAPFRLAAGG